MVKMADSQQIVRELGSELAGQVLGDNLTLAMYSTDASIFQIRPACVVIPEHREDVQTVVRYAREHGLSVIARGSGSGLAGESLGEGIVLDFTSRMNRMLGVDLERDTVTVQPGVVLEWLNRQLRVHGKMVGPDPASGSRATFGGMIANNATGAHSLVYGYIGDHLKGLEMVWSDGEADRMNGAGMGERSTRYTGQVGDLLAGVKGLLEAKRPKSPRHGSGYNLYGTMENNGINLRQLIAGSEGTLGIVTEAEIGLVDIPRVKMLAQLNFDTLGAMARCVPAILEHDPAACELMDGTLLELTREAHPDYRGVLPDGVAASLLVELAGGSEGEVRRRIEQFGAAMRGLPVAARCRDMKEIISATDQALVWKARKAALPLLFRRKSAYQPTPIIEDVAVPPEALGEYLDGLTEITRRLEIPIAYYAHAGHGEIHPRPYLDLHQASEIRKMRQLADEVFKLAWKLGGSISGEHGEGLVRAAWIRQQVGDEVYEVLRGIKGVFDPENRLNPGKIINDDPDIMEKNLRFQYPRLRENWPTNLVFRKDEFRAEIEQCNGNGLCRTADPTLSMCPVFRATGDEKASPRAKGNLMRCWFDGLLPETIMQTAEFKQIADLCINCKMCASECPSLVNIPKLMMEARAEYVKHHGLTRAQWLLTRSELLSMAGSLLGPVSNAVLRMPVVKQVMAMAFGLDRRRDLPPFDWGWNLGKLRRYLKQSGQPKQPLARVVYFVDLFANYNDHALGRATVDVLRHHDIEVVIPAQMGCAVPAVSYGDLGFARMAIEHNVRSLVEWAKRGYQIICSEPTAALALKHEYLDVVGSAEARLVSGQTRELTDYLSELQRKGQLKAFERPVNLKLAYHRPCHYEALAVDGGTVALLKGIEGLQIERLPVSCCGMAGTFGFQSKSYDLSIKAGEPMLQGLQGSDCDYGLTECSTCRMQMEGIGRKKTLHPVKVLAAAWGYGEIG